MTQTIGIVAMYAVPVVFVVHLIGYARLRFGNLYADRPDPQLGRKAALHYLLNGCVLMVLFGLTLAAADAATKWAEAMNPDPTAPAGPTTWLTPEVRGYAALVVSGLTHGAVLAVALRLFTNDCQFPAVRRSVYGFRLVLGGIILVGSNTYTLVSAFAAGPTDLKDLAPPAAISGVWGPVVAWHAVLLLRGRRGEAPSADVDHPPV